MKIADAFIEVNAEDHTDEGKSAIKSSMVKWAAGLGVGAVVGKAISDNMDISAGTAKLGAQMGLTSTQAAATGKVAGDIYRDNFGGSLDEVNDSIRAIGTNIGDVSTMSAADLKAVSEGALGVASTFDVDVADSTRAVGALMKNGLAPDAKTAMDIVTFGFQHGADKSGDFVDTLNEYSPAFAKLGIDGASATALISTGLQNGARDGDLVADAFKEFGIRAIDGSKSTSAAYKSIGLDANKTAQAIAKGGPSAKAATSQVIQSLAGIKDPIKQNAAGVALFGTQWEDLGPKVVTSLSPAKAQIDGVTGATDKMNAATGGTAAAKIETMKRKFEGWGQAAMGLPGPLGAAATGAMAMGGPALAAAGSVGQVTTAFGGLAPKIGAAVLKMVTGGASMAASAAASTARVVAQMVIQGARWVWMGVQAMASAARIAAAWLISMGPIVLVVAAVVGLGILIYKNFDNIKKWIGGAWTWVKGKTVEAWDAIKSVMSTVFNVIKMLVTAYFNAYKAVIVAVFNAVKSAISTVWDTIRSLIAGAIARIKSVISGLSSIITTIGGFFGRAKDAVVTKMGEVVSFMSGLPGRVIGAVGNMGSMLYNSGQSIIQGLIDGIKNMAGNVADAVHGVLSAARNLLPFSPAKEGPFSGKGWTTYSGAAISNGLADGITSSLGSVKSASAALAGAAHPGDIGVGVTGVRGSSPALAGAGLGLGMDSAGRKVELHVHGDIHSPVDVDTLMQKMQFMEARL